MSDGHVSRGEMLLGASAATLAGLTACNRAASSLLSIPAGTAGDASELNLALPAVVVSKPTGAAIQAAIDSLGSGGGNVYLAATVPYLIKKSLLIASNSINLIGKGPNVTKLLAKKGAILTNPYQGPTEYLLLVQNAANISITGLRVDTANEANSPGNPRMGIGVWSSSAVKVGRVTFVNNLGANGTNQSLSLNESSNLTVDRCDVSQSRNGIFVWQCTKFVLNACGVRDCEVLPPHYPLAGAIQVISSTSGSLIGCALYQNKVYNGIWVTDGADLQIRSCKVSKMLPFPIKAGRGNDGISIQRSTRGSITVQDCDVAENSGAGVSAWLSSNVTIENCTIIDSGTLKYGGSGVSINGGTKNVHVKGNHISNKVARDGGIVAGFFTMYPPDSEGHVFNNIVQGFSAGVALGSNSDHFEVEKNDLRSNKLCHINYGVENKFVGNLCS